MINKENTKSTTKTTCQVNTGRGFTSHIYIYGYVVYILYTSLSLSLSRRLVSSPAYRSNSRILLDTRLRIHKIVLVRLAFPCFSACSLNDRLFFLLRFPFRLFFTVIVYAHELNTSAYEYMYVCPRFE